MSEARDRVVTIKMRESEVERIDRMLMAEAKRASDATSMPLEISRSAYVRNLILEALEAREGN